MTSGQGERDSGRPRVPSQGGQAAVAPPSGRYPGEAMRGSPKYRSEPHSGPRRPVAPSLDLPYSPAPRRAPEPARTGVLTALGVVAIAALLGLLTFGGYLALSKSGAPPQGGHAADRAGELTVPRIFPGATVGTNGRVYQLLKSQGSDSCAVAATGDVADLLAAGGCGRVVRGTLTSPDRSFVLTAGVFDLRDEAHARQVADGIPAALGKGRLTGYAAGGASGVFATAPTRLGWDVRGQFLLYCVVARATGGQLTDQDARPVIEDLVEAYLPAAAGSA